MSIILLHKGNILYHLKYFVTLLAVSFRTVNKIRLSPMSQLKPEKFMNHHHILHCSPVDGDI